MDRRNFLGLTPSILLLPYIKLIPNEIKKRTPKVGDRVSGKLVPGGVATITTVGKYDEMQRIQKGNIIYDFYYPGWKNSKTCIVKYDNPHPYTTKEIMSKFYPNLITSWKKLKSINFYLCEDDIIFED